MPDWLNILSGAAIWLLTTIGAAYFSALCATRRAFEQRWWERKEKAYVEIIEALYEIVRYLDLTAEEYLSMKESEPPKKGEFQKAYNEANWKIQRAADIGSFVISEKAASVLQKLKKRPKLRW